MVQLKELLKDLNYRSNRDLSRVEIRGIKDDSRLVRDNDLFIAVKGAEFNGHHFIEEAVKNGAAAVFVSNRFRRTKAKVPFILVRDTRKALAAVARNFYEDPTAGIKTIGITGTNGKTTVSYLVESILTAASRKVGRIGTINYHMKDMRMESVNTTPSALLLNQIIRRMVELSADHVVMEVSSHSLDQHRTDGIRFDVAVFTNISPEHLDYHRNFRKYLEAKKRLFSSLNRGAAAVLNMDDPSYKSIRGSASSGRILTFGIDKDADIMARNLTMGSGGSEFTLDIISGCIPIRTGLIGAFNISNILAAAGAALACGIDLNSIKRGIEGLAEIPGRLQAVPAGKDFRVFIDYAHTDDALKKVLETLNAIKKKRLIVVFGCGGERDRAKRPRMGRVASLLADYVIITSDNPRREDPALIAGQVEKGIEGGFSNYELIPDREKAIERALVLAKNGDLVLIAGKGHERCQIIGERKIPFSDAGVVREVLAR